MAKSILHLLLIVWLFSGQVLGSVEEKAKQTKEPVIATHIHERLAQGLIPRFNLSEGPLRLSCHPTEAHFISALGEQAGLWGTPFTGMEAWIYPFKLGASICIDYAGDDPGGAGHRHDYVLEQSAMPHLAQVQCRAEEFNVIETYFVPRREPAVVFWLDIESRTECQVQFRIKPSLAPMLLDVEKH